jgi:transcriptional regulator with XRE-family HTH domain
MPMKLQTGSAKHVDHIATGLTARAARMKSGRTLTFVARRLGFSVVYLSDLELGKRSWSENLLRKYEKAL